MILEREQINRYLRQILIPEISGPGQKKLLQASVFICGENVSDIAIAVYYLAAAGIGRISYQLEDETGIAALAATIQDLNPDTEISGAGKNNSNARLFLGRPEFILARRELIYGDFVPTVIAIYQSWQGGLYVAKDRGSLDCFLSQLMTPGKTEQSPNSTLFANWLGSSLGVLEAIKLLLAIGASSDFLVFDMLAMEFSKVEKANIKSVLQTWDNLPIQEELAQLANKKVLIVGTGGLGSPVAYALALAGVGTIGLVDYDVVELSNLNRQILHAVSRLGIPKVESAARFLKQLKPDITLHVYNTSLNKENVAGIVEGYDLVVDAVDNFPTRFLLNDACYFARKPMIDAGVIRFDGTARTILPQKGPCYRCTLPAIPSAESVPSCSEAGVLGPVPGIMGFIQAAEAVKYLLHQTSSLTDKMLYFDGLFADFVTIKMRRNVACPLCGTEPVIHELQDYEFRCADENEP